MIETIITSSILILIIVILRYLLRGKIALRLQYALWALVAIRLLLPFPLFESPLSVMNALPSASGYSSEAIPSALSETVEPGVVISPNSAAREQSNHAIFNTATRTEDYKKIATYIWLCGGFISGMLFVVANVRLHRNLKQSRKQVNLPDCKLTVYTAQGLPSPCLYGLWKPAIYLTPESLASQQRTAHIIAHELTHYRHGDHIWSFVRAVCVCIHWFNPLVWLAAMLSRRDSELACDEGTLQKLGDESRTAYGKTLIEMMTISSEPANLLNCATTMTGDKREITERIKRIAKRPKMLIGTLVAVLLIVAVTVVFTFGGRRDNSPLAILPGNEEFSIDAQALFNARTPYVGDNSAVARLIGLLPVPAEGLQYDHFALYTDDNTRTPYIGNTSAVYMSEIPYIEIIYSVSSETLAEYDHTQNNTENSQKAIAFRKNALLLLALVDNAEAVRAVLTDGTGQVGFFNGREWADSTVGGDVRDYAGSPEKLQELIKMP